MSDTIINDLFETEAFKVAAPEKPFWFTSGLIGPYFIATHYLCGGREVSESLLSRIDTLLDEGNESVVNTLPLEIKAAYEASPVYASVVNELISKLKNSSAFGSVDCISGGERRDWFFSIPLALELKLPHVFLFKNGSSIAIDLSSKERVSTEGLSKSVHLADLLTIGSSYTSMWVPMLKKIGIDILESINVVDRNEGGVSNLEEVGIPSVSCLCRIEPSFFEEAKQRGFLSPEQLYFLTSYASDPFASMKSFVVDHPEFVAASLNGSEKDAKRAQKMLDEDVYGLGEEYRLKIKTLEGGI